MKQTEALDPLDCPQRFSCNRNVGADMSGEWIWNSECGSINRQGKRGAWVMAYVDGSCSSRLSKLQRIYIQLLPTQRFREKGQWVKPKDSQKWYRVETPIAVSSSMAPKEPTSNLRSSPGDVMRTSVRASVPILCSVAKNLGQAVWRCASWCLNVGQTTGAHISRYVPEGMWVWDCDYR